LRRAAERERRTAASASSSRRTGGEPRRRRTRERATNPTRLVDRDRREVLVRQQLVERQHLQSMRRGARGFDAARERIDAAREGLSRGSVRIRRGAYELDAAREDLTRRARRFGAREERIGRFDRWKGSPSEVSVLVVARASAARRAHAWRTGTAASGV
jgi:hypothetical protein